MRAALSRDGTGPVTPAGAQGYRPEIDGLRAVAVVSVILFHAGFGMAPGGFVGVDVFFVISGFLITGIIADDLAAGRFSFRHFYARRARRILPALAVMLVVCAVPAWFLMTKAQVAGYARMATAVALFHSNVLLARTTGYFDAAAEEHPLLHTWSLAVEEQYYFAFPVLMFLCWKWGRTRLLWALAAASAMSLAVNETGWRLWPDWNFYFTPSRIWELLLGAGAAMLHPRALAVPAAPHRPAGWPSRGTLAALGLAGIVLPVALLDRGSAMPASLALLPTVGTALVLSYGTAGTWVARILSTRLLVGAGLVSYSAYLWHQPLLVYGRLLVPGPMEDGMRWTLFAMTFALAYLSWRLVEQPLRKMNPAAPGRTLYAALACTAALAAAGAGLAHRATSLVAKAPPAIKMAFNPPARTRECFDIPFAHQTTSRWLCDINAGAQAKPSFMLFGDSHALQLLDATTVAARQTGRTGIFAGYSGCVPLLGVYMVARTDQVLRDCHALNSRVLGHVRANGIKDVILVAQWNYYTQKFNDTEYLNAIGLARRAGTSVAESRAAFERGVAETVKTYAALGVQLYVLEQVPQQAFSPQATYEAALGTPATPGVSAADRLQQRSTRRTLHDQAQAFTVSVLRGAAASRQVTLLNADDVFCDSQTCLVGTPQTSFYRDRAHLSDDGAKRLEPMMGAVLARRRQP